jgi:multisubunit Na+/H+ antiporter MnhF subunit
MSRLFTAHSFIFLGLISAGLAIIISFFVFLKEKNPVLKVATSGVIFTFLIITSILFTAGIGYNISYLIDIIVIYFILGFSNILLYFVFFNKRS